MTTPEQLEAIRVLERPRPPSFGLATGIALASWCIAFFAFSERNPFVLCGAALVCAAAGVGARRRNVRTGLLMLLASLPWMIFQDRRLAVAMAQDLKDGRWTAYALDGAFASFFISAKALVLSGLALLAVDLVDRILRARSTRKLRAG